MAATTAVVKFVVKDARIFLYSPLIGSHVHFWTERAGNSHENFWGQRNGENEIKHSNVDRPTKGQMPCKFRILTITEADWFQIWFEEIVLN